MHLKELCMATLLGCVLSGSAWALDNTKPITVIVPYGPGGLVDFAVRVVMENVSKTLKTVIVIDNRPGASAGIGTVAAIRAKPDGHTLVATGSHIHLAPILDKSVTWKSTDLAPVARLVTSSSIMVVGQNSPYRSFSDLINASKAGKQLTFGTGSLGVSQSVAMGFLKRDAQLNVLNVLYKSGPSAMPDVVSSTVDLAMFPESSSRALIESGQLRPIATTSPRRLARFPHVPTFGELGFAQAEVETWVGIHAPVGTANKDVDELSAAIGKALADPALRAKLVEGGATAGFQSTAEFKKFLVEDLRQAQEYGKTLTQ